MPDNTSPLLVPVAAEALVVNHRVQSEVTFHRWEMEYANLLTFESPAPQAFSNLSELPPDPGIHLHWALPRALTQGTQVQATAKAEVSGGAVTKLTVMNGGYGYDDNFPPVVTIVGAQAAGASANAVVKNGIVTSLQLVSGGAGYETEPMVTIAPSQAISFPYVPNRWLVVRYSPAANPTQPRQTMAWLLQSDSLDPNASSSESNSFVNPFPSEAGAIEPTRLGTKPTVLQSWAGESGEPQKLFLQALGPGDATFTAYQPGVVNVFSFYDPLYAQGATSQDPNYPADAATFPDDSLLSYLIVGWYSDATHDPLYGPVTSYDAQGQPTRTPWTSASNPSDQWKALMNALDWSAPDADEESTLPSQTVYHASVYDVLWQTKALPMGVTEVNVTSGGSGYTTAPAVTFSGGGGTGATAVAEIENGAVVNVVLTSGGTGYTSRPAVSFNGGGGTGAEAVSQIWNDLKSMTVAVGNSSIDALAAIVQKYAETSAEGAQEAELLEAFQYNFLKTLDDADGEAQLDLQIRQAWFATVPGGTFWQVVAAQTGQTATGQLSPDAVPPPPPLTTEQAELLAELNRKQRKLDEATQLLATMQWELYATWWKQNAWTKNPALQGNLNSVFGSDVMSNIVQLINQNLDTTNKSGLYAKVVAQQSSVAAQQQALPSPTDPLSILNYATNTLGLDPAKLQLKATAMPRFYQPADPVVLVSGIQTSAKQGALNGDSPLPCRFASQAVTGVNVESGNQTTEVTSATIGISNVIPAVGNQQLPQAVTAGVNALSVETFFVDPANAATIVTVGLNSTDAQTITNLANAMTTHAAQVSSIMNPLDASYAFSLWATQAWSPLYMEWQVTFYPTVQTNPIDNGNEIQDNWAFIGVVFDNPPALKEQPCWSFNGTDFDWYGGNQDGGWLPQTSQSYIGRTFLTPQSTYVLASRLKKYLEQSPDAELEKVEALINKIGDWDFLSQRLSGFVDQLIMRDLQQSPPPDSSISNQVGDQYRAVPDPTKGNQDFDFGGGTPFFFPVRGGFLQFNQLTVVDSFGQVVDLMSAGGNIGTGVPWAPVRGRGLAPMSSTQLPQPSELIQLAPRMVQPARLDFRFVSATDDTQEIGLYPNLTPVCGWVLPNHLDKGLAVYDASGNAIGELLLLADTKGNENVSWLPAPDSTSAVGDPSQIPNKHLSQFVTALTETKDQGTSFNNFLQAVDETLWTVDPLGSRADQNLSVLIGRPLALLRAQLTFELQGEPVYNQSWPDTLRQQPAGIEAVEFPVRLGSLQLYDDGLMGYFAGDNYASFNSVHQPAGYQPARGSYLQPIGYDGNYIKLHFNYLNYETEYITMLLDPRGDAHAFTGLFPVKVVSLPSDYFEDALKTMAVTFRTGPVITDRQTIRLPYPTEKNGTWSWIQRNSPASPQDWVDPSGWDVENIVKANQNARLPDQPARLVEGWLKLTPSDMEK